MVVGGTDNAFGMKFDISGVIESLFEVVIFGLNIATAGGASSRNSIPGPFKRQQDLQALHHCVCCKALE